MNYELRDIGSKDIFPIVNIIKQIGLKEIKEVFDPQTIGKMINDKGELESDKMVSAVGGMIAFDIAIVIVEHLEDCKKDLYSFISSMTGVKVKDLEEIPPADFLEIIIAIVKKEEFVNFFKVALKFLK